MPFLSTGHGHRLLCLEVVCFLLYFFVFLPLGCKADRYELSCDFLSDNEANKMCAKLSIFDFSFGSQVLMY